MPNSPAHETEPADESAGHSARVTPADVVAVACEEFARLGFSATQIDVIAKRSHMSKRMIHYHFGDKKGLYSHVISACMHTITPAATEIRCDSPIAVDGIRQLVDALFDTMTSHPDAVRVLALESVSPVLAPSNRLTMLESSEVGLVLDRLLLRGQDSGAFRPGITAQDVFYLIVALLFFGRTHNHLMLSIAGVNCASPANSAGLHRLVVDTVLSFLTSNIDASDKESYLTTATAERDDEQSASLDVYWD